MKTKLTLTIEDSVIHAAKKYTQSNGSSLSEVVENYLRSLAEKPVVSGSDGIHPRVKKLMGVISLPDETDYKMVLGKALSKKYKK